MSGVFPVGCGSAAPREHIIERRCLLRKYNKFFLIPLFFMMVFFIPSRCSAAVKETDAASSVSDSVKKMENCSLFQKKILLQIPAF